MSAVFVQMLQIVWLATSPHSSRWQRTALSPRTRELRPAGKVWRYHLCLRRPAPGVAVFHSTTEDCAFVADPGTNDIAAIDSNLKAVGRFHGGPLDINNFASMALAINKDFLYAALTGKANSTLGVRRITRTV
jgi:hypothetical protein